MVKPNCSVRADNRGQAYTLEAFTASLLLVGAILFALQVTAVTPLTASTSSQHIENQQSQIAGSLLDSAIANGSLTEAVLYWNETAGEFEDVDPEEGFYAVGGPPLTFGQMLNRTFLDRGIAANVNMIYINEDDNLREQRMVHFGTPSDNAVTAFRTITLYDDDEITSSDHEQTVKNSSTYFAPDLDDENGFYNVVRVEITVWRM